MAVQQRGLTQALGGKSNIMAYYSPSIFYPIVGASHDEILHFAATIVRQPVFLINDVIGPRPDNLQHDD